MTTTSSKLTKESVLAHMTPTMPGVDKYGKAIEVPTPHATKALIRGLGIIYRNQTSDEQASKSVNHENGEGFTGTDANILTDFYETIQGIGSWTNRETGQSYPRKGPRELTTGQLVVLRKLMLKYAGQIARTVNAQMDAHEQASIEAEVEAERANERYFEERNGGGRDYHEEDLMRYDRQCNPATDRVAPMGEAFTNTIRAMVDGHASERDILTVIIAGGKNAVEGVVANHKAGVEDMGTVADEWEALALSLPGVMRSIKDLINTLATALRGRAAELLMEVLAGAVGKSDTSDKAAGDEPAPVAPIDDEQAPDLTDDDAPVEDLRVYSKLPTLDNIMEPTMPARRNASPATPAAVEEPDDEFDAMFPKHDRKTTDTNVVEALEEWFTGKRGGNRYTKPSRPISEMGPWAMATLKTV